MWRAFVMLVFVASPAWAEDWPQFRGPDGQGRSSETGLPLEWSESRNVVWKVPVGPGWSSPIVADGRVWLTTAVDVREEGRRPAISLRAVAFDAADGRQLVDVEVFRLDRPDVINPKNSYASPTPILDGDRVYVHFGANGTAALATDGRVLWTTRLRYESQHGAGGSPVLYRGLLIVNCDGWGDEAYVAALDAETGRVRWRTSRRRPWSHAYSTPLVITVDGADQLVSVGAFRVAAYEPLTGREIWRASYGNDDGFSNVPRPVFGNGLVYVTTGFQVPSLLAVRVDGRGDVTRTHVAWRVTRGVPYTPSPLLVGGELYFVSDIGILTCVDAATGDVLWQERLGGNFSASPVIADGRIFFLSEEGQTTVLVPGRQFHRLAVNRLDGPTLASFAIAGGSIFVRSATHLYRIASGQ
jgi:outer membrane protein assembly factor BamB